MSIDKKLLDILVCPITGGPLEYDEEKKLLVSISANVAYPIIDGIPIMIPEEAINLSSENIDNYPTNSLQ